MAQETRLIDRIPQACFEGVKTQNQRGLQHPRNRAGAKRLVGLHQGRIHVHKQLISQTSVAAVVDVMVKVPATQLLNW